MWFLQIRSKPHLDVEMQLKFPHSCLCWAALAAYIWFQSVFCVTGSGTHDDEFQSDGSASEDEQDRLCY